MKNITYINAGAGSGKTYKLTETLCKHLKDDECEVSEIIMTTFTEMAAADLRKELKRKLLQNEMYTKAAQLDDASIGTVHSIAFKYIQRYWYKLGVSASVTVIDDARKNDYVKSTLSQAASEDDIKFFVQYVKEFDIKDMGAYNYDFWRSLLEGLIDKASAFDVNDIEDSKKQSLQLAKEMFKAEQSLSEKIDLYSACITRLLDIYQRWSETYKEYKWRHNAIEFNDMESMFLQLLDDEEVKQDIRDSVKYVFVDEFQDSNPKQIRIFEKLSELVQRSYWVGDSKQAIYGFRACDVALVQAVMKYIKDRAGKDGFLYENLDTSYRSVKQLVNNTNKVFVPLFKDMTDVALNVHRNEEMPTPSLLHWDARKEDGTDAKGNPKISCDADTAYDAIAAKIHKMLKGDSAPNQTYDKGELRQIRPSDIAILALNNDNVNKIAQALRKHNVPVSTEYIISDDNAEIKLVSLLLNYLIHPDAALLKAELSLLYDGVSTADILNGTLHDMQALDELRAQLAELPVSSIVRRLILRLDLIHQCGKWGDAAARKQHLTALISHAVRYDNECIQRGKPASVDGYLAELKDIEIGSIFCGEGVNVMTYHKSKGLQWPVVIMCSLDRAPSVEKSFTRGVNAMRTTMPTADNFYSDYHLLCMPACRAANANVPKSIVEVLNSNKSFLEYSNRQIEEQKHLMYVGATRARDYLITVSKKGSPLKYLSSIGIESAIEMDKSSKKISLSQYIWGKNTTSCEVELIMPEGQLDLDAEQTFHVLDKENEQHSSKPKYLQPSKAENQHMVDKVQVKVLYPTAGQSNERITCKCTDGFDVMGTCIHNFMAVYEPCLLPEENTEKARRIVDAFRLTEKLSQPSEMVRAAKNLYTWLEEQYGKPCKVAHEVPFMTAMEDESGQIVNGEIDMLWYTSEDKCVLIDFKNYPGEISDVIDSNHEHYAGMYAPQLDLYRSVLRRNGIKVEAVLVFYAVLGCVVSFENQA